MRDKEFGFDADLGKGGVRKSLNEQGEFKVGLKILKEPLRLLGGEGRPLLTERIS